MEDDKLDALMAAHMRNYIQSVKDETGFPPSRNARRLEKKRIMKMIGRVGDALDS